MSVEGKPGWYCVHTQPKRETVAEKCIRVRANLEVFNPRITYFKKTRRGRLRYTEALFPGYLFVYCDIHRHYRMLLAMQGVVSVLKCGGEFPSLPDGMIRSLSNAVKSTREEVSSGATLSPGCEVLIHEGPFSDFTAIVTQPACAGDRIHLLLDFLGRQLAVALPHHSVMPKVFQPKAFLRSVTEPVAAFC